MGGPSGSVEAEGEGLRIFSHRIIRGKLELSAVVLAISVGVITRLVYGWQAPLWLDEAYTGTIASQSTLPDLINWCLHELSGPFYYGLMWTWAKLSGSSDLALRLPSFFFATGAIAAMALLPGPSRRVRLIWAGLGAVWLPGLMFASLARPQALLFLLAVIQVNAFLRCMDRLSHGRLVLWSTVTALMLLTHFHSAVISGVEFAFLAFRYRWTLARNWAAFSALLVPAAWLPLQAVFLIKFLQPGMANYKVLTFSELTAVPWGLFGNDVTVMALLALIAAALVFQLRTGEIARYSSPEKAVIAAGMISVAVVVAVGMTRSSYHERYLVPYVPALLFGVTLLLARARLGQGLLPAALLLAWSGATAWAAAVNGGYQAQQRLNEYELERASQWLMERGQRKVIFVWGNTGGRLNDPELQSEMAGFSFRRAGYPAEVTAVTLDQRELSPAKLGKLARRRSAAILWLDGPERRRQLTQVPGFACQLFGIREGGAAACVLQEPDK